MPRLELNLPYTEEGEALATAIEEQFPGVRRVDLPNQSGTLADRARQSYPTPPPVPPGAKPQDWRTDRRGIPSNPRGAQNMPSVVGPDGQRQERGGRIPGVTVPKGVTRRQLGGGFNVHPTTGTTGEPLADVHPALRPKQGIGGIPAWALESFIDRLAGESGRFTEGDAARAKDLIRRRGAGHAR